ncbi:conserved protein of unknown function [Nitrospira japonica]|uniref:DUF218 domain-containing protein n=1 Tax=Nitrospira japonica TaxID=1325564 RepID=A0A1W1I1K2_9BACT|nr:YdcF family protein [Nitrospira japonica]SLM46872.1 conserved protein of unknown function [Nitrospira japonica]
MELTPFLFGLYKTAKYVLYPLSWVVILLTMTTWLLLLPSTPSRLRWARIGSCACLFTLLLISSPLLSSQFIGMLEAVYPATPEPAQRPFDAIVVLGGGILDRGTLRPSVDLTSLSRERTTCGADLYLRGYASKLVVTGGDASVFGSGPIEAVEMKRWANRLGVPDDVILIDNTARNTYENATATHRLLQDASIVLVSSASHLPRAAALFKKQGFRVTPVPCGYFSRNRPGDVAEDLTLFQLLPADSAISHTREAVVETMGAFFHRLMGQL